MKPVLLQSVTVVSNQGSQKPSLPFMLPLWESFDSSALATSITSLHKDRKTLLIPSFEAFGLTKGNSALSGWQFICLHVDVEKVKAAVMLNFRVAVSWNQGISELAILSFCCVLWVSDHTHYNPSSVAKSVKYGST